MYLSLKFLTPWGSLLLTTSLLPSPHKADSPLPLLPPPTLSLKVNSVTKGLTWNVEFNPFTTHTHTFTSVRYISHMFIPSTELFPLHFICSSLSPLTYLQFFLLPTGFLWVFTGSANFASQPPSQLSNPPCRPCGSGKLAAEVNMSHTRVVNTGLSNDILWSIWEDKWCEYESHINY